MIKRRRRIKGLTQSQLARKVKISGGYMSKLENKMYGNVTIKVILNLSKELDVCPVKVFLFFKEQYEKRE